MNRIEVDKLLEDLRKSYELRSGNWTIGMVCFAGALQFYVIQFLSGNEPDWTIEDIKKTIKENTEQAAAKVPTSDMTGSCSNEDE